MYSQYSQLIVIVAVLLTALEVVSANDCSMGSIEIDGNWYCQPVTAITYTNVGTPGLYNDVVNMAPNGVCSSTPVAFSGPISPLNEELSVHFRGPIQMKQFAIYSPVNIDRRDMSKASIHRHGHQHEAFHKRAEMNGMIYGKHKRQEVTATTDGQVVSWGNSWFGESVTPSRIGSTTSTSSANWVTATIDGQVVSWVNNWFGTPAAAAGPSFSSPPMVTATIDGVVVSWLNNWFGETVATPAPTSFVQMITATINGEVVSWPNNFAASPAPSNTFESASAPTATEAAKVEIADAIQTPPSKSNVNPSGNTPGIKNSTVYQRIGYYNSAEQILDNLVFLGNYGGQGSGVFDEHYGASLSYVNSDATSGASSPQILADVTVPSDSEVTIMTAQQCSDNSCGYVRPGAVAYHGFAGADKVFLFDFVMPMDGEDAGFEQNEPAIWLLNAKIPRTLQYGDADCSCWESGCGEFDIVEALTDGSARMKSTLHDNVSGGDSDYIIRPISTSMKLAVVFSSSSSTIQIQVLPGSTDFSSSMTAGEIEEMCISGSGNLVSLFSIA